VEAQTKKKGLLGSLREAFVEEVPEPAPKRNSQPPAPPVEQVPAGHFTVSAATPPAADPAAIAKLEAKLKASLPPVYTNFMDQFELLRDTIPDEGMRFKAALKTSRTSVADLSKALDQVIATMEGVLNDFSNTCEENKTKASTQMNQSIAATDALIESRKSQMKAIEEELASLQTKRATDQQHLEGELHRFEQIRLGFIAAHAQVMTKLNTQRNQIASQG
jgi:hypothetical protein